MLRALRRLFGEDIFISYSRADGLRYATALANELTRRHYACRIDQYDTVPGAEIPARLRRSIRQCRMMVVVASPGAAASERVGQEIAEFLRPPFPGHPLVIAFGDITHAVWRPLAVGLPVNEESPDTLAQGTPAPGVLELVDNSFQFRKRNRRLMRVAALTAAVIVVMIAIGAWGVNRNVQQLTRLAWELGGVTEQRRTAVAERDRAIGERDHLATDNAAQRNALQASTRELERVGEDLGEQKAEVARQTAVNEALRAIGDADVRQRARGYSTPNDLVTVLASAQALRAHGRRAEAQEALEQVLQLQPRLVGTIKTNGPLASTALIDNGRRLVTSGSPVRVWDLRTAREVASLPGSAFAIVVSADGSRLMTVTRSGEFRVLNARTLETVGQWSCRLHQLPTRFALSSDGSAAAAGCAEGVRLVHTSNGAVIKSIPQPTQIMDLWLGKPEGFLVVVADKNGGDNDVKLFAAATGEPVPGGRCESGLRSFVMDPLAERIVSGCDSRLQIGDSRYCQIRVCKPGAADIDYQLDTQATSLAVFSEDGRYLATSESGIVRVWDSARGTPVSQFDLRVRSDHLRFSGDGSRLVGRAGALVWVSDTSTGRLSWVIHDPSSSDIVVLSNDAAVALTGTKRDGTMHLWEAAALSRPTLTFNGAALGAVFNADGRYLVGSGTEVRGSDRTWFKVWDRTRGAQVARWADDSADRDARLSTELETVRQTSLKRSDSVVTTDGRHLASRGTSVVDVSTGAVVFSSDQPVLAVGRTGVAATGSYGLVQIWRMANGQAEERIRVAGDPVAASFSPDDRDIAIAAGTQVESWRWSVEDLTAQACRLIADNRTVAPWTALTSNRAYRDVCGTR